MLNLEKKNFCLVDVNGVFLKQGASHADNPLICNFRTYT